MSDAIDGDVWAQLVLVRQPAAQDETLTREQVSPTGAGPVTRTVSEEKGQKPTTITLQDGCVVDAARADSTWELLKDFPQKEAAAFQTLLALAHGRPPAHADKRQFEALEARGFVIDDHSIDPVTRAVLLNSSAVVDGKPMIGALRLQSEADRAVLRRGAGAVPSEFIRRLRTLAQAGRWP